MQKKLTGRRRRRRLDRDEDIREKMQPFIDQLFELYEETDPSKGHVSEPHKLQRAQRAIDIWWHIYGRLLLWAQSQIVGYEIARSFPKAVDKLMELRGSEIYEDSHELSCWDLDTSGTGLSVKRSASIL
jgi:hypothetical protein